VIEDEIQAGKVGDVVAEQLFVFRVFVLMEDNVDPLVGKSGNVQILFSIRPRQIRRSPLFYA
jgi:hypothetical protein